MSEWIDAWMNEWMNEWMKERLNECRNEWMNENVILITWDKSDIWGYDSDNDITYTSGECWRVRGDEWAWEWMADDWLCILMSEWEWGWVMIRMLQYSVVLILTEFKYGESL